MSLITVKDLHFSYPAKKEALNGVNLEINDGEFVCVLGENGSREKHIDEMHFRTLQSRVWSSDSER